MNPTRKTVLNVLIGALAGAATLTGPAAAATWPASVGGTWTANGAGFSPHTIHLTQTIDSAKCKKLTGTLDYPGQPQQKMYGFYCPQSGRIVLTRVYTGETIQIWHGQLSQPAAGQPPLITGSIAAVTVLGGRGEAAFFANRVN